MSSYKSTDMTAQTVMTELKNKVPDAAIYIAKARGTLGKNKKMARC